MTKEEIKEQIKSIADIVEILDYLGVENNGKDVICPFHNDHSYGSCKVSRDRKSAKCYACGANFDVFSLWLKVNNLDSSHFTEAVRAIGKFYGIDFDTVDDEHRFSFRPLTTEEKKLIHFPSNAGSLLTKDEVLYKRAVIEAAEKAENRYKGLLERYGTRNAPDANLIALSLPTSTSRKEYFLELETKLKEKITQCQTIKDRFIA